MPLVLRNTKGSALTYSELDDNFSFVQLPVGCVLPYAGSSAPTNFLLCYGQAVSRTTYADLFAAIGTTFGAGDGATTFNLPDLRGRMVAGQDNMGGSAANRVTNAVSGITGTTLGSAGGSQSLQTHTHTASTSTAGSHAHTANVTDPGHVHSENSVGVAGGVSVTGGATPIGGFTSTGSATTGITVSVVANGDHTHTVTVNNEGAGTSQNMPPTIILTYIIRAL